MLYAAASALMSFSASQDVTAHNVANISTPGFKQVRTSYVSQKPAGVRLVGRGKDLSPGSLMHTGYSSDLYTSPSGQALKGYLELSNVDLAEQTTRSITDTAAFRSVGAYLGVQQDMDSSLLDIVG